ncbi:Chaperone protein PapD [Pseudomonas syringae pv. helianthi]|uniref:Chaperone protein PapD n=1 Tax=Pseudomonas syringae pv. helianthi TaxID=251654 RepID=A0A0P9RKU1_9PSED|nr:molecular chaperone [Pseudomonas syringae group genomosp. 7]KPX46284.1 Chaperone protein PapD [Pseudomonas syringae pv. helianthi]RMR01745.1 Chaperone protein PapD [Pseudomonas syringae pv. helianthi]UNB61241.1 molecular chaperone [Pseudomonas syringae pv. helianthi]
MFPEKPTVRARALPLAILSTLLVFGYQPASNAALVISGTRVIFNSDKRSVSLIISNPGDKTYAAQTWVNTAADDTTTAVPFLPSPPLFRLDPKKEQQLKINGLPNDLPRDRESLFYFNVQEIPQADTQGSSNVLNIALRTRIKLFYRPVELKDNPVARLKDLQWSATKVDGKTQLYVENPTPFHVSFTRFDVKTAQTSQRLNSPTMVGPFSSQSYLLDSLKPGPGMQLTFATINDYGGVTPDMTIPVPLKP